MGILFPSQNPKDSSGKCFRYELVVHFLMRAGSGEVLIEITSIHLLKFETFPTLQIIYKMLLTRRHKENKYGCTCKASIVKRWGQVIYELVREPDV